MISYFEKAKVYIELPSLIIMDYSMPLMNGLEALIKIKRVGRINHIPFLIYTTTINPLFVK
jgi:CheY-like chemotaxis protein